MDAIAAIVAMETPTHERNVVASLTFATFKSLNSGCMTVAK
jgi:hypothetical protein